MTETFPLQPLRAAGVIIEAQALQKAGPKIQTMEINLSFEVRDAPATFVKVAGMDAINTTIAPATIQAAASRVAASSATAVALPGIQVAAVRINVP